ncbi:hypothetical protein BH24ACT15_BH24ACT15_14080 [soil metagenome]
MRKSAAWMVAAMLLLGGCQLSDAQTAASDNAVSQPGSDQAPALGSPDEDWPATLDQLQAFADPEAWSWQDQPVLADVTVWLRDDSRWERVRMTYVAADAEHMLTLRSRPDELRLDRPRLAGLQLLALPQVAVDAIQPLPEQAVEPAELAAAAAPALAECGSVDQPPRAVLYATGAPAAWDGNRWTRTPTWRATVVTESTGVVVDVTSGQPFAPLTCVEPVLLTAE